MFKVVTANATTLTELRVDEGDEYLGVEDVRALLQAGPKLEVLEAAVYIDDDDDEEDNQAARAVLRNEPPFQALRLRRLFMFDILDSPAAVVRRCSYLRCHLSLEGLNLSRVALNTDAAMGAVVDACIVLRLRSLALKFCDVITPALPQLTRLIAAGALRQLTIDNFGVQQMFDEAHESTRLFVVAVRASALTRLWLQRVGVLSENVVEAAAFINARQQYYQ